MPEDQTFRESHLTPVRTEGARTPLTWLLDFFSGIRLCVVLLTTLFVYCSIGSAGMFIPEGLNIFSPSNWSYQQVRQWPVFELTEFEWFHTWFFYAVCGLLCVNMSVATVRRIPLNAIKFGSWMIHGGIIMMTLGCVIYFATKIEGDAPVWRRMVVITVPGGNNATMPAIPGSRVSVQGSDGTYLLQIADINPSWPLLSGDDEGESAYSVSVQVTTPRDTFVRQLLAGYPQYTEDLIPGEGRVKKIERFAGAALVDPTVALSLAYDAQDRFWIKDSSAIMLRRLGESAWNERPVRDMPRYNAYLRSLDDAHPEDRSEGMLRPLDALAEPEAGDTLADISARVIGYLPYAELQTRNTPSPEAPVNPVMNLELYTSDNVLRPFQLVAFDPENAEIPGGGVRFEWVDDPAIARALDQGASALLTIEVPEAGVSLDVPFTPDQVGDREAKFTPIEGTEYAYRVTSILPRFPVGERMMSLAIVEFETPDGRFARWVADDPAMTRDLADGAHMPDSTQPRVIDPRFKTTFGAVQLSPVTIVAGPPEVITPRAIVMNPSGSGTFTTTPLQVNGQRVRILPGQGIDARIAALHERSERKTLPRIVPQSRRDTNTLRGRFASVAQVELTHAGEAYTAWTTYHQYTFDRDLYYGRSTGFFNPARVTLNDGRTIEIVFSRETEPLPNPVVLDDFVLEERVGGYTKQAGAQSVRNWTSELRFLKADGSWTDVRPVSANDPKAFGDLWFFQATWDPPRPPSQLEPRGYAGLNHTGLGVGNREGVWTMLIGSVISVLGMVYAFYIKPIIKRRRRDAVHASVQPATPTPMGKTPVPERTKGLALWFLVGVLCAAGIAYLAVKASVRSTKADPETFAGQVDLTPLDRSAVYSRGRLKSFDSFANELLGFVTGTERINGLPKDFTYLDLMFVPEAYQDEPIIYVKKPQIRNRLIGAADPMLASLPESERPRLRAQLDEFRESGLVTPRLFELDPVRAAVEVMRRDVVKTAKFATQIDNALTLRRPDVLGNELRLIPPPEGRADVIWLSPMELFADPNGNVTTGMVSAGDLEPTRRTALQDSFSTVGDFWFQTRALERREAPVPLDEAFESTMLTWANALPDRLEPLRERAKERLAGIGSMSHEDRLARLDEVGDLIAARDSGVAWTQSSRYFALVHVAELAIPEGMIPGRITAGAERTSDAIVRFCELLPQEPGVEGALYPNQSRLMLESWYFKLSGATWIWIVYLLSVLMLLMAVVYKWAGARAMGMGFFTSAFVMHTIVLGWRWYVSGRWPNSNMFEAVTTSVWLGTLCVIAIEVIARRTPMRNLFALTAAGASMVAMMSAAYLPQLDANINNMMPILHDLWLYIHTNVIIASYALIAMSAITGLLYLAWRAMGHGPDHATVGGTDMLLRTAPSAKGGLKRATSAGAIFDGATMILIELSFIMLWAGLVMGAIWADHSWGRPWGWDPKEVFALNTFFVYLILIHVRFSSRDKGLWTALLALVGCGVMLFNWIVINFIISGLHSYA